MDYTKDEELMKLLERLANEVQGYLYSTANKHWNSIEATIIETRTKNTNAAIEKVKQYLLDNTSK